MRRFFLRLLRRLRKTSRVVTVLLYAGFGLLIFLLSLSLSLPVDKIKDRLERELSQEIGPVPASFGIGTGFDVSIGELDVHVFPPGASAVDVRLRPRKSPAGPDAHSDSRNQRAVIIDRLEVRVRPLDALFGKNGGRLLVESLGGEIVADAQYESEGATLSVDAKGLTMGRLSAVPGLLPLPTVGNLTLSLQFDAPMQKQSPTVGRATVVANPPAPRLDLPKATGKLDITLSQASLGDGKAKLVVPGDPFLSQGLTFPRIRLGDVIGHIVLERGRATITSFAAKSADVEIWIDGSVELRDPMRLSELRLYVRFKPSAALTAREPTLGLLTSSQAAGKRPDGTFGFAITGPFMSPRARAAKEPPDGVNVPKASLGAAAPHAFPQLVPAALPSRFAQPPAPTPPPAPSNPETFANPASAETPPANETPPPPNPLASEPPPGSLHAAPPGILPVPPG